MRRLGLALVLLLLAVVAAGCDLSKPGGEVVAPAPTTVEGEVPTTQEETEIPKQFAEGDPAQGKSVFAEAGCGGCHALADAGSSGNVGPNLDQSQPELQLIINRVSKGQGGMPAFEGRLSNDQIADVSAYVYDATQD